jgi:2-C-methyl-D-erythritol 4-phosphate cytidylyltransferase/2-C-methyl-D-erythritol 2,4-cyclodiphosphate synthase
MAVGVIIVAGGRGERMGGSMPKQLLDVGGRSMLQRSVSAFDTGGLAEAIIVVLPDELVSVAAGVVGATTRPCRYVAGGARRHDSVRRGLAAVPAACDLILIHDAARPFVDREVIARVIAATERTGAAVPAIRARDTVKHVPAGQRLVGTTIPRDEIWLAQTPQGFRRQVLDAAIAQEASRTDITDEAMLAERAGHPVEIVDGDERNVKITTPADLAAARLATAPLPRVGTGYDLHQLVAGRPLVLAGVLAPFERGPLGHSDGDVVCHALADAMFGASGAGDIGQHFSNTDARWRDVAGLDLLARAVTIVGDRGWRVANADVTVVLERPMLAPHVPAIRERLAAVLQLDVSQVSVKGKTNEGVDAVGRGEAIAAHAIVLLTPHGRMPLSGGLPYPVS